MLSNEADVRLSPEATLNKSDWLPHNWWESLVRGVAPSKRPVRLRLVRPQEALVFPERLWAGAYAGPRPQAVTDERGVVYLKLPPGCVVICSGALAPPVVWFCPPATQAWQDWAAGYQEQAA